MPSERKIKSTTKVVCIFCTILFVTAFFGFKENDFTPLREEMVKQQIKARGIKDIRIIKVMEKIERHKFVPPSLKKYAYEDRPLPIGYEQTISTAHIVALMTELLRLEDSDKVLEIGTGSGYQAAILAELVDEVYTIEIIPDLAKKAEKILKELGYKNVFVRCGDGYLGWPQVAPFDKIIVTCSSKTIPPLLIEQLKEGGRMVVPLGDLPQKLIVLKKRKDKLIKHYVTDVLFVPMRRNVP
jgi:protein-L-isoaspartate(D-aspartate) O-methyltransferase